MNSKVASTEIVILSIFVCSMYFFSFDRIAKPLSVGEQHNRPEKKVYTLIVNLMHAGAY